MTGLYTLAGLATHQEDIRKSRFVAMADGVQTPEDALRFIATYGVPDATHNCWAYRIGQAYRFNDDGEPGGTAGRPILQAIEGLQCDRIVVLVVRWFGGIKLGAGGLVRAYGGTAAQCLRRADKIAIVDEVLVDCHCGFADMAVARTRLLTRGARLVGETFDEAGVRWQLAIVRDQEPELARLFTNLTRGQGRWQCKPQD
ncbi:IMPACT family protein [Allopusillimonas ginsengisoli]|uniref:IMPACT family protein n=1 Tax=Allopusillimonas ginsengisoli TaxID=453575 RepID=UPI001FD6DC32|nr:YigZ family protein [Allopusillimonas ginsengisoli]